MRVSCWLSTFNLVEKICVILKCRGCRKCLCTRKVENRILTAETRKSLQLVFFRVLMCLPQRSFSSDNRRELSLGARIVWNFNFSCKQPKPGAKLDVLPALGIQESEKIRRKISFSFRNPLDVIFRWYLHSTCSLKTRRSEKIPRFSERRKKK